MNDLSFALSAGGAGLFIVLAEGEADGLLSSFFCAAWAETPRQSPPAINATAIRETNGNNFFIECGGGSCRWLPGNYISRDRAALDVSFIIPGTHCPLISFSL